MTLVDPLAIPDLSPLAPVFTDPSILLVFHAGDNDLVQLNRRQGFTFVSMFDTAIAARFLGARSLGLDALVQAYLGLDLPPSRQKDDWSARPLTPSQEEYAAADVEHLIPLKDRLTDELRKAGRLAWVEEECAALAAEPPVERPPDPDAYQHVRGARDLSPVGLGALRELHTLREQLARDLDRPPFKILSDDTLFRLAEASPADASELEPVPGCTPRVRARWGEAILAAVRRGHDQPTLLVPTGRHRPPAVPVVVRRRIDALRRWRDAAALRLALDPGVLLPNRLIRALADAGPKDRDALMAVEGFRRWRVDALGDEVLVVLASVER